MIAFPVFFVGGVAMLIIGIVIGRISCLITGERIDEDEQEETRQKGNRDGE